MLEPILDSIDTVPEALRGEYELHDGKFHLQVKLDDKSPWRPVAGLTSALASERNQRSTAVTQRETLKREQEQLRQQLADLEARLVTKPGDDVTKTPAFEQFKKASEDRILAMEKLLTTANEKTVKAELEAAETRFLDEVRRESAPFVRDDPGVLDDFVERRIRPNFSRNEQGAFVSMDGQAERYSLKNAGQPMAVKEFIAEVAIKAPEAAYMLRPSRGAGVVGSNGTRVNGSAFAIHRGAPHDEYMRVKEAADKAGQPLQVTE